MELEPRFLEWNLEINSDSNFQTTRISVTYPEFFRTASKFSMGRVKVMMLQVCPSSWSDLC